MGAYTRTTLHRRVVVNLQDGSAMEGVLVKDPKALIVLKNTVLHQPGMQSRQLDGDVVIERARILFVQIP